MKQNILNPGCAGPRKRRQTADHFGIYARVGSGGIVYDSQPNAAFHYKSVSVGQKSQAERMGQSLRDYRDPKPMLLCGIESVWLGGEMNDTNSRLPRLRSLLCKHRWRKHERKRSE